MIASKELLINGNESCHLASCAQFNFTFIDAVNLPFAIRLSLLPFFFNFFFFFFIFLSKVIRNIHLMNTLVKSLIHAPKKKEAHREEMCFVFLGTKLTEREKKKKPNCLTETSASLIKEEKKNRN